MNHFIDQYVLWVFKHSLYQCPREFGNYWALFKRCPATWLLALLPFKRSWTWWAVVGGVMVQCAISPIDHYLLQIVPLLAVMASMGLEWLMNRPVGGIAVLMIFSYLAVLPLLGIAKDIVRPWRVHSYSINDDAYVISKLPKDLKAPIWTNWDPLYVVAGWQVPTGDFMNLAQLDDPALNDFTKEPLLKVNTRIELVNENTLRYSPPQLPGWRTETIALDRGQFPILRIRRKK